MADTVTVVVLVLLYTVFEPADIEDITFKTGNFKKFSVFIEMLESALTHVS